MPIRVPANSPVAPRPVAQASGARTPGGFLPAQLSIFQSPLDRNTATARNFSGGIEGLESIGQGLGSLGGALDEMRQKIDQFETFNQSAKEREGALALDREFTELSTDPQFNTLSIQEKQQELERIATPYRETSLNQDFRDPLTAARMKDRVAQTVGRLQGRLVFDHHTQVAKDAALNGVTMTQAAEDAGDVEAVSASYDERVSLGLLTQAEADSRLPASLERARFQKLEIDLSEETNPADIDLDEYGFTPAQMVQAKRAKKQAVNLKDIETYDAMFDNPGKYTESVVENMVEEGLLSPKRARSWISNLKAPPLDHNDPILEGLRFRINSYDRFDDVAKSLEMEAELRADLAEVKSRNPESVKLITKSLDDRISKAEDAVEAKRKKAVERITDDIEAISSPSSKLNTDLERQIHNATVKHIDDLLEANPQISEADLRTKALQTMEMHKRIPLPGIYPRAPTPPQRVPTRYSSPPPLSRIPTPIQPLIDTFTETGNDHGIDPKFLTAVSIFETGGGTSSAFRKKRNAMGVSNASGPISFESHKASIDRMARVLASPNGPYAGASTIDEIARIYSPPGAGNDPNKTNHLWPFEVKKIYRRLGGDPSQPVK